VPVNLPICPLLRGEVDPVSPPKYASVELIYVSNLTSTLVSVFVIESINEVYAPNHYNPETVSMMMDILGITVTETVVSEHSIDTSSEYFVFSFSWNQNDIHFLVSARNISHCEALKMVESLIQCANSGTCVAPECPGNSTYIDINISNSIDYQ